MVLLSHTSLWEGGGEVVGRSSKLVSSDIYRIFEVEMERHKMSDLIYKYRCDLRVLSYLLQTVCLHEFYSIAQMAKTHSFPPSSGCKIEEICPSRTLIPTYETSWYRELEHNIVKFALYVRTNISYVKLHTFLIFSLDGAKTPGSCRLAVEAPTEKLRSSSSVLQEVLCCNTGRGTVCP